MKGVYKGATIGVVTGIFRSLDYGSYCYWNNNAHKRDWAMVSGRICKNNFHNQKSKSCNASISNANSTRTASYS